MNARLQHDEATFLLHEVYAKLLKMNAVLRRAGRDELLLTDDDLALIRWAFNMEKQHETV